MFLGLTSFFQILGLSNKEASLLYKICENFDQNASEEVDVIALLHSLLQDNKQGILVLFQEWVNFVSLSSNSEHQPSSSATLIQSTLNITFLKAKYSVFLSFFLMFMCLEQKELAVFTHWMLFGLSNKKFDKSKLMIIAESFSILYIQSQTSSIRFTSASQALQNSVNKSQEVLAKFLSILSTSADEITNEISLQDMRMIDIRARGVLSFPLLEIQKKIIKLTFGPTIWKNLIKKLRTNFLNIKVNYEIYINNLKENDLLCISDFSLEYIRKNERKLLRNIVRNCIRTTNKVFLINNNEENKSSLINTIPFLSSLTTNLVYNFNNLINKEEEIILYSNNFFNEEINSGSSSLHEFYFDEEKYSDASNTKPDELFFMSHTLASQASKLMKDIEKENEGLEKELALLDDAITLSLKKK